MLAGFVWSTFASMVFLGDTNTPQRKALAVYPMFLFYLVMGWMVISHTDWGLNMSAETFKSQHQQYNLYRTLFWVSNCDIKLFNKLVFYEENVLNAWYENEKQALK